MTMDWAVVIAASLALAFAAAATGARFRPGPWYARLRKPPGLPPAPVFPVVWTVLYVLMALAAARVYMEPAGAARSAALVLYGAQLLANAAWSWLFFGRHRPLVALVDLALLLLLVTLTIAAFAQVDRTAAVLLAPYWSWLCVAAYLNAAIWWLNRGAQAHR